jgi:hypothetical protein
LPEAEFTPSKAGYSFAQLAIEEGKATLFRLGISFYLSKGEEKKRHFFNRGYPEACVHAF